jgi:hypothetical protein
MSQILNTPVSVTFSAEGVPSGEEVEFNEKLQYPSDTEINYIMSAFGSYHKATAERLNLNDINEKISIKTRADV